MSAVITALVAKVDMDTSAVSAGSAQVRKDAATVSRVFREMETDTDKLERKVKSLHGQYKRGAISAEQYQQALNHVSVAYNKQQLAAKKAEQAAAKAARGNMSLGDAFSFLSPKVLAASAAFTAFYGAMRLVQDAIKLAADLEEVGVRFQVLTGSADDAGKLVNEMRNLANTTALTFGGLQQAAQVMLSFGVASERIIPSLKQIGDITSGNSERMASLSLAFAQSAAAGRLMGQDLLQMINAGFNPLQEISRKTGISIIDLKKRMEQGAISFDLVSMAFESATGEGGMFNDMLEKSKGTLAGSMRQLNSDIEVLKTQLGEELLPIIKDLVSEISKFSDPKRFSVLRETIGFIADNFTRIKEQLISMMGPLSFLRTVSDFYDRMADFEDAALQPLESAAEAAEDFGSAMNDALNNAVPAFETQREQLQQQLDLLRMGEEAYAKQQRIAEGITEAEAEKLAIMERQIAAQKAAEKQQEKDRREQEQAAEKAKKDMEQLKKQGQDLMNQSSPVAAVGKQLSDLQVLLRVGAIDQNTFMRERNKILKENLKTKNEKTLDAEATEVGSAGFVKRIADQFNDMSKQDAQVQKLEEQRLLQEAQLVAQKETNRRLQEMGITKRIQP